jgi:hypothetical protein
MTAAMRTAIVVARQLAQGWRRRSRPAPSPGDGVAVIVVVQHFQQRGDCFLPAEFSERDGGENFDAPPKSPSNLMSTS